MYCQYEKQPKDGKVQCALNDETCIMVSCGMMCPYANDRTLDDLCSIDITPSFAIGRVILHINDLDTDYMLVPAMAAQIGQLLIDYAKQIDENDQSKTGTHLAVKEEPK